MPYIKKEDRLFYDALVDQIVNILAGLDNKQLVKGHHNYIMYTLALKLVNRLGVRYATLQDIIGTFDCCKMEFYRKILAPYEEKAIDKNGDVSTSEVDFAIGELDETNVPTVYKELKKYNCAIVPDTFRGEFKYTVQKFGNNGMSAWFNEELGFVSKSTVYINEFPSFYYTPREAFEAAMKWLKK